MAKFINDGEVIFGDVVFNIGGYGKRRRQYLCEQVCIASPPNSLKRGRGLVQYHGFKTGSMVVRMFRRPRRSFIGLNFKFRKEVFYIDAVGFPFMKDGEIAFSATFRKIYK